MFKSTSLYGSHLVEVALSTSVFKDKETKQSIRFLTIVKESDHKNKSRNKTCSGGVQLVRRRNREIRPKRMHMAVDVHPAMWKRNKAALTF